MLAVHWVGSVDERFSRHIAPSLSPRNARVATSPAPLGYTTGGPVMGESKGETATVPAGSTGPPTIAG